MNIEKRTWGGMPAAEAFSWNGETKKYLGEIIGNLHSGDASRQKKGYIDFYEFKRHFILEEWEAFINSLNDFRVKRGFLRIEDMANNILQKRTRLELASSPFPKSDPPGFPDNEVTRKISPGIVGEQLSLF